MKDELFICIVYFISLVGISLIISIGREYLNCISSAKNLDYSYKYDIFAGCIVENKSGKRMLLKQLRNFEE